MYDPPMIPPKGTLLRSHAEAAVHLRRVRRAFLAEPQVQQGWRMLQRVPWWVPNLFAFMFMAWAVWYGDPGWMLFAGLYAVWVWWVRR